MVTEAESGAQAGRLARRRTHSGQESDSETVVSSNTSR